MFVTSACEVNMDVDPCLLARKEEESKAAIPKDRRAHADDDGKRGGARLVAIGMAP